MNDIVCIIPARYSSSRFPGKVLVNKTGKYLVQHVWEQVRKVERIKEIIIATDDDRISDAVLEFGGRVVITSPAHESGTDRIAEVAEKLNFDIILNVQADEPDITPSAINQLIDLIIDDPSVSMATLCSEIKDMDELMDPNVVKVITCRDDFAIYFSRAVIPYIRGQDVAVGLRSSLFKRHIGIYIYRKEFLLRFTSLPPSLYEAAERLEQLRAIENGYRIKVGITDYISKGIDTPLDYEEFIKRWKNMEGNKIS